MISSNGPIFCLADPLLLFNHTHGDANLAIRCECRASTEVLQAKMPLADYTLPVLDCAPIRRLGSMDDSHESAKAVLSIVREYAGSRMRLCPLH